MYLTATRHCCKDVEMYMKPQNHLSENLAIACHISKLVFRLVLDALFFITLARDPEGFPKCAWLFLNSGSPHFHYITAHKLDQAQRNIQDEQIFINYRASIVG